MTTYTSPNDGRVYGIVQIKDSILLLQWRSWICNCCSTRPARQGHITIDPTYDLVANGVIRYITSPF